LSETLDKATHLLQQRGNALAQRALLRCCVTLAALMRYHAVVKHDLGASERILQELRSREIPISIQHYAALVQGYAASEDMESAMQALVRAQEAGITPSVFLYTTLIVGYSRLRQARRAQEVFDAMLRSGVKPDVASVDALANAWLKEGADDRAKEIIASTWPHVFPNVSYDPSTSAKTSLREFRRLRREFNLD
jgi:pentatricopeptide repeat protein